jgi:hypothetical protein
MWEDLYKYVMIVFSSMIKFVAGPAIGAGFHLPFWITAAFTAVGMMLSVVLFTSFLGNHFHQWIMRTFYKNRKLFTKSNRRKISIWKKYGLVGVAFLTPILFTPIGGAMIANGFGETKERIFIHMFVSAVLWALIVSYLFTSATSLPFFGK